jgi:hypothetical protein
VSSLTITGTFVSFLKESNPQPTRNSKSGASAAKTESGSHTVHDAAPRMRVVADRLEILELR